MKNKTIKLVEYGKYLSTDEQINVLTSEIIYSIVNQQEIYLDFNEVIGVSQDTAELFYNKLIDKLSPDLCMKYIKFNNIQDSHRWIFKNAFDKSILNKHEEENIQYRTNNQLGMIDKCFWNIMVIFWSVFIVTLTGDIFNVELMNIHMLYIIPITTSIFIALGNYFYKKIKK